MQPGEGALVFVAGYDERAGDGSRALGLEEQGFAGPRPDEAWYEDHEVARWSHVAFWHWHWHWHGCWHRCGHRRLPTQPPPAQHDRNPSEELSHSAVWRQLVFDRVRMLEGDLATVRLTDPMVACEVDRLLTIAWDAARQPSSLVRWWQGTLIDRAWLAVHDAEVLLTRHLDARRAAERWQAVVGRRPRCEAPWGTCSQRIPDEARFAIAQSLEVHLNERDSRYTETRVLRNRLLIFSSLGLAFVLALILLAATGFLAFDGFAGGRELALIAVFGAIGAYIVHLPSVLKAAPRRSPYCVAGQQLTVKLTVGPLFALLGIMAMQSDLLDQLRPFEAFGIAALVWATILGGSQQFLTGLIDRRASNLVDGDTDRDRDSDSERAQNAPVAMMA